MVTALTDSVLTLGVSTPPAAAHSCSGFRTCAEAMRSLSSGNTRSDGDGDGIPCEALCGSGRSAGAPHP